MCALMREHREPGAFQLCTWQSLKRLLALTAPVYAWDFQAGCWQSSPASLRRVSAGCKPHRLLLLLLLLSHLHHLALLPIVAEVKKKIKNGGGFMEPHNDTWQMCSTGVIVNGGSCADSLDDGKSVGPHFGLPVWILMARFQAMANDEENSLIKTWCDGQRPAGSLETVKVNSVPSGVRS